MLFHSRAMANQEGRITVTVGLSQAEVIGTDNVAIQKAIDRVTAAGGGTVLIEAGTYSIRSPIPCGWRVASLCAAKDRRGRS
jgi:dihydroxyacetone kinase DhaKLM complex PTS-EIIA-like component DhaM